MSWWSALLDSAEGDLTAIAPESLPPMQRVRHAWVSAWVRGERILNYYRAPERWDPVSYVERATTSADPDAIGGAGPAGLPAPDDQGR